MNVNAYRNRFSKVSNSVSGGIDHNHTMSPPQGVGIKGGKINHISGCGALQNNDFRMFGQP